MSAPARSSPLRGYLMLSLVWLAVVGVVWFVARRPSAQPVEILPPPTLAPTPAPQPSPTLSLLRVDVAGAVLRPGVYRLPPNSIVADAIAAAGGAAPEAALDRLNKAATLQDGNQVYVPRAGETPPVTGASSKLGVGSFPVGAPGKPVDLNHATPAELDALPGIGPSLAAAIVEGRPYSTADDLLRVPGIGPATLAKLKPYVEAR